MCTAMQKLAARHSAHSSLPNTVDSVGLSVPCDYLIISTAISLVKAVLWDQSDFGVQLHVRCRAF